MGGLELAPACRAATAIPITGRGQRAHMGKDENGLFCFLCNVYFLTTLFSESYCLICRKKKQKASSCTCSCLCL